ncbi:hypothetical protein [Bacillus sp. NPDC094106]|uniref:hypothetical protein n=1 Tax=Bacillus sp. NPDC094106 TaxID=3363949 RepID=UPI003830DC5C
MFKKEEKTPNMYKNEEKTINHYERINFLKDFRNNGYVKKVLCVYEDVFYGDVVYYNNREKTDIPCIENDIFILSNYKDGINTYTLVQIDFSIPSKYKILLQKDSKEVTHPKEELYEYIKMNHLVETKDKPTAKKPQIDLSYGSIFVDVLMNLNESHNDKLLRYNQENLFELIQDNAHLSNKYKKFESEFDNERTPKIRFDSRALNYIQIIFDNCNKEELTINELLIYALTYQENYYYNL